MKKMVAGVLTLVYGAALLGAEEPQDGRLFLQPHLELVQKSALVCHNVGCHLPSTTHLVSQDGYTVIGLGRHLEEMASSLQPAGLAVVTTPASYGVVFTRSGVDSTEVSRHIEQVLSLVTNPNDEAQVISALSDLSEVLRATFAVRDNQLTLVTDEKQLRLGEAIFRKNPDGVEKMYYHSEEEYLVALTNAGFRVDEIKRPCFFGELKWKRFNNSLQEGEIGLGEAYKDNNPFTLFYITKLS